MKARVWLSPIPLGSTETEKHSSSCCSSLAPHATVINQRLVNSSRHCCCARNLNDADSIGMTLFSGSVPPDQPHLPDAPRDHLLLLRLHAAGCHTSQRHRVCCIRNEDLGNGESQLVGCCYSLELLEHSLDLTERRSFSSGIIASIEQETKFNLKSRNPD